MLAFLSLLFLPERDRKIGSFEAKVTDCWRREEETIHQLETEKNMRKEGDEQLVKTRSILSNKQQQFEALQKKFEALQSTLRNKQH